MPRSDAAGQRFFRAFYQWKVLVQHHPAESTRRCVFHSGTSRRLPDAAAPDPAKIVPEANVPPSTRSSPGYVHLDLQAPEPISASTYTRPRWTFQRAQSHIDRPFTSLSPGTGVVRRRKEQGLKVECAVSVDRLQRLRDEHGYTLESFGKRHAVALEIQDLPTVVPSRDGPVEVHSVTISGLSPDVARATDVFLSPHVWPGVKRVSLEDTSVPKGFGRLSEQERHPNAQLGIPERDRTLARGKAFRDPELAYSDSEKFRVKIRLPTASKPKSQMDIFAGHGNQHIQRIKKHSGCAAVYFTDWRSLVLKAETMQSIEKARQLVFERWNELHGKLEDLGVKRLLHYPRARRAGQLKDHVRQSLRTLTHPVAVITASVSEHSTAEFACCRGVTVSSFTTVTMDPQPIISFNLKVPSRTWDAIETSGNLRVHILEASEKGATIAHAFTQPYEHGHEPFQRLLHAGVQVSVETSTSPPVLTHDKAILAIMEAKLLPDHCVQVTDHNIVVAQVVDCSFKRHHDESQHDPVYGLSYAQGRYRLNGDSIELSESLPLGERAAGHDGRGDGVAKQVTTFSNAADPAGPVDSAELDSDAKFLDDLVASPDFPSVEDDADEDHALFEQFRALAESESEAGGNEAAQSESNESWEGKSTIAKTTNGVVTSQTTSRSGNESAATARSFCTIAGRNYSSRPSYLLFALNRDIPKTHESLAPVERRYPFGQSYSTFSFDSNSAKLDDIVEPAARGTNVADFFGIPDDNRPWRHHRVRGLVNANREAAAARSRLQNEPNLTAAEAEDLRLVIASNERHVARKLAWNSACVLRRMLDRGRVDFTRARWHEGCIERGQAVLLEDAQRAKDLHWEGKIDQAQYKTLQSQLERDHAVLSTETMRLRQVVDEEADGSEFGY